MKIKCKIWIERNGRVVFGRGREDILKAIEHEGSLHAAARKLEMSYRAAWGRLKASEERMAVKLVETGPGSKLSELTPEGKTILERFERLEKDLDAILVEAQRDFKQLLP